MDIIVQRRFRHVNQIRHIDPFARPKMCPACPPRSFGQVFSITEPREKLRHAERWWAATNVAEQRLLFSSNVQQFKSKSGVSEPMKPGDFLENSPALTPMQTTPDTLPLGPISCSSPTYVKSRGSKRPSASCMLTNSQSHTTNIGDFLETVYLYPWPMNRASTKTSRITECPVATLLRCCPPIGLLRRCCGPFTPPERCEGLRMDTQGYLETLYAPLALGADLEPEDPLRHPLALLLLSALLPRSSLHPLLLWASRPPVLTAPGGCLKREGYERKGRIEIHLPTTYNDYKHS